MRTLTQALESAVLAVTFVLVLVPGCIADGAVELPVAVSVRTPGQFQDAVRLGVKHVVISEHLDMVQTPRFSETTIMDAGMIAIVPNSAGEVTASIRGNCSSPPVTDVSLDPPLRPGQCLVTVREDFLEMPLLNSVLWISQIYVEVSFSRKNHSTLIGAHGGDMYLTNMAFVADGDKARAIDVKENRRIYVANSHFSGFSKDKDAVIRMEPGARATVITSTFLDNEVASDEPDVNATGPVMGLYSMSSGSSVHTAATAVTPDSTLAAAAWLWNCSFANNRAPFPGLVAVSDRSCRVFTNTPNMTVWDRELSREVPAWPLERIDGGSGANSTLYSTLASVTADGVHFLQGTNASFQSLIVEEAVSVGLPAAKIPDVPVPNELATSDPYPSDFGAGGGAAESPSFFAAGVVAGIVVAALIMVVVAVAIAWRRRRTRKKGATTRDPGSKAVATGQMPVQLGATPSKYSHTWDSCVTSATLSDTHGFTLPPVPPPGAGASARQKMEFVQYQLDTLGDQEFLNGLVVEPGPSNRMHGGQAVIQFAKDRRTRLLYAVKFFLSSTAFADESGLYMNPTNPLGPFLPALRNIADGTDGSPLVVDARGRPLPPCIVMEKGESLDVWMQRNRGGVDMITCLQVIQHVAERLADLHAAGFVHRDLKLSNVMWLPRENRWTLIDFGCAACVGDTAPLAFSLQYAPPEVVRASRAGCHTIRAQASMDAWSLGIIAWELFCKQAALDIFEGKEATVDRILGRKPLPWEAGAEGSQRLLHQLGRFRPAVLGLLQRDEAARLTIPDFISRCRRVIEETRGPPSSMQA